MNVTWHGRLTGVLYNQHTNAPIGWISQCQTKVHHATDIGQYIVQIERPHKTHVLVAHSQDIQAMVIS